MYARLKAKGVQNINHMGEGPDARRYPSEDISRNVVIREIIQAMPVPVSRAQIRPRRRRPENIQKSPRPTAPP
ncbi:hypothetical protein GCM10027180_10570 [Microbulbifer echini]